jgi:hypothetical protein
LLIGLADIAGTAEKIDHELRSRSFNRKRRKLTQISKELPLEFGLLGVIG